MRNRLLSVLVFAAALMALPATAGSHKTLSAAQLDTRLKNYVLATRAKNVVYAVQPYMESYSVDDARRVLTLNVSTSFATQNFTEKSVGYYYKRLAKALPKPYNRYQLRINTAGMPIEQLVPGAKLRSGSAPGGWGRINYDGAPWVMNESQPNFVSHGPKEETLEVVASKPFLHQRRPLYTDYRCALSHSDARERRRCGLHTARARLATQ